LAGGDDQEEIWMIVSNEWVVWHLAYGVNRMGDEEWEEHRCEFCDRSTGGLAVV
jgi:hypothetical protein